MGRQAELARIDSALDALSSGDGARLVEVSGEAGIGKTRLLDELCERAQRRDFLVFRGRAAEFERGVPFAPVVEALDDHLATLASAHVALRHDALRSELGAVFPSLRGESTVAAGLHDERYRAYRAVRELLERLSGPRPLAMVIDDAHWADDASVELVSALLQKPPAARVMIVLAARAGRLPASLESILGTVERSLGTDRVTLGPLDRQEAEEMLGDLVDPSLRRSLFEAGGGNPFFMEQLARTAGSADRRGHDGVEPARLEVPAAVAGALAEEIAGLSEHARLILQAAAVAGQRFEPDLVADIAGVDETIVLEALDDLLDSELVKPTDVPRRFVFRHPLVWRAVYEGAKGGWRLAAHRAAAKALAARGAPAAERAHHVEHAAVRGDRDAVVLLRAAGASVVHRTPAAAALWFRAALRLLPESPAHDDERRALFTELASALRGSGDLGACREALRDALDLTAPDDLPARTALEARCATVESWLGRADEAHRRLRRARAAVRDDQSREAVTLDVRLALEALNGLEFDEGVATASRALASARKLDDHALLCEAAAALSLACALAGSMKEARDHRATAVRALESLPEAAQADRLEIFFYLAWAENNLEELELGIATAERGMALSRATGQGHLLVPLMLARLLPLDRLGRLAEAIAAGEEAIEAARTSPNPQYLYWALWECAYSHALAGDFDRAMPLFEESVEASRGLASNFLCWAQPGSAYGYALAQAGDPERGYRVQLEALGGPEIPRIAPYERVLTHADLTEALVALDRLDDAAGQADRAEALAEQLGQVGVRALAAQARATLLLAQGDPAAAVRVAAAAREPATAAGLRLDGAFLQRLEGIGLARTGQREAAVAALRECERDLDSFPARRARDDVRRELRKLGARVEARKGGTDGASGLGALSAREREVVELVADRHMNKQIAAALFLSEKTVESHLRSVFRKLGVSSRVDVARAVERERAER